MEKFSAVEACLAGHWMTIRKIERPPAIYIAAA